MTHCIVHFSSGVNVSDVSFHFSSWSSQENRNGELLIHGRVMSIARDVSSRTA
jgi:hypothetical protein